MSNGWLLPWEELGKYGNPFQTQEVAKAQAKRIILELYIWSSRPPIRWWEVDEPCVIRTYPSEIPHRVFVIPEEHWQKLCQDAGVNLDELPRVVR